MVGTLRAQAAAHRSMKQFARHVRAGILTTSMPSAAKTSSNVAVYVVADTFTARRHFDRSKCRRPAVGGFRRGWLPRDRYFSGRDHCPNT
jgi:hypothetical protein